jgi:REP element-mobilizing transposase RayT
MPRCARVKSFDSVYHIMVRGISDVKLFRSSADKEMYLRLIKKYQQTYLFKVYAYCLMDTHAHLIIDCNGADISKIMHCINQCYAQYYNRTYNRRGHLFQDRFKSKIIYDDNGLIRASAYVNKNSKDIKGFKDREEKYRYSSYGIYTGIRRDDFGILDPYFILNQFSKDIISARRLYLEFVRKHDEEDKEDDNKENSKEDEEGRN